MMKCEQCQSRMTPWSEMVNDSQVGLIKFVHCSVCNSILSAQMVKEGEKSTTP